MAIAATESWLNSRETIYLQADEASNRIFIQWMRQNRLRRKRINDTRIASIYYEHGATDILTTNVRDFSVFEKFNILQLGSR